MTLLIYSVLLQLVFQVFPQRIKFPIILPDGSNQTPSSWIMITHAFHVQSDRLICLQKVVKIMQFYSNNSKNLEERKKNSEAKIRIRFEIRKKRKIVSFTEYWGREMTSINPFWKIEWKQELTWVFHWKYHDRHIVGTRRRHREHFAQLQSSKNPSRIEMLRFVHMPPKQFMNEHAFSINARRWNWL